MSEVFLTSPWVPPEWIAAHGLKPRGIWQAELRQDLSAGTPAGVCAFAESLTRLAARQSDSLFIFTTHCDQLRRACDTLVDSARNRIFLFNLPSTWQSPAARQLYRSELERLSRFLMRMGGHSPETEEVHEALMHYTESRKILREAARWCFSKSYAQVISRFLYCGEVKLSGAEARDSNFIPVALAGGPLLPAQFHLFDSIQAMNGQVVLNATETGERILEADAACHSLEGDLVERLVAGFFDQCVDVFQRPNTKLYDWLGARLKARKVRGLILWHYGWCDLWRAEAQSIRNAFGIPVLTLETDDCGKCSSRNLGQVQAFMESLGVQ